MTISPLLESAIESLAHGIEHYFLKYGTSNKFPLLHLDQAVELLLKAKIQSIKGERIYTRKNKTIDYHECFNKLKDFDIPERSILEEIHDKRNVSQHIGSSFDDYSIGYYVKFVYLFFKKFMVNEFDETLDDYLSYDIKTYVTNIVIEPSKIHETQLEYIENLIGEGKYEQSVISSWNALEFLIKAYSDKDIGKSIDDIIELIKSNKKFEGIDAEELKDIYKLKDSILFNDADIDLEKAQEIHDGVVDLINSKIVIVPVNTPEKISKRRLSDEDTAEPVRIIDDTTPVENEQELFFTNLKLYNSNNEYVSDANSILKLYKKRIELEIEDIEGYEFLTQSAIHHKLPCWFWANELTADKIAEIISRNLKIWGYYPILYSLNTLLLLSNKMSTDILQSLTADKRMSIALKSSKFLAFKNDLHQVRDYFGINGLKRLEHLKKINPELTSLPKPFTEKIINKKSNGEVTVIKIIQIDDDFKILSEIFDSGDENTEKTILDSLSYIKDEKSISFFMAIINDIKDYSRYKDVILRLDAAVYCPKAN